MSIRLLIYLAVFVPFLVSSGVNAVSVQQVIARYEQQLETARAREMHNITRQLEGLCELLSKACTNLSRPREVSNAVDAADNDVLFDWSRSFVGQIDSVIFTDVTGIVLSRAPDEYSFGDNVGSAVFFRHALEHGEHAGIEVVDGELCLVSSRLVRKYNDMPVGVVACLMRLSPERLRDLTQEGNMVLTVRGPDGRTICSMEGHDPSHSTPVVVPGLDTDLNVGFAVDPLTDRSHEELLQLKKELVRNTVIAGIMTLAILLLVARWQFGPYARMVEGVLAYSDNRMSLSRLHDMLLQIRNRRSRELSRAADALVRMVETMRENVQRVETLNAELQELASCDPLTGLLNRRSMAEALDAELKRARRYGSLLSAVMMDVDHFKRINDERGHQFGDEVLRVVARCLTENSRATDIICRWGGEEFLILCPGISQEEAAVYAEKLRERVGALVFGRETRVTASFGVSVFAGNETEEVFLARADEALYRAKESGRNNVQVSG